MRRKAESAIGSGASFDRNVILTALESLLKSRHFATSPRACRFLRYVVEASLDGRESELKERLLGTAVFDRGPSFDPAVDTIVRVVAANIRNRLRSYYRGLGRTDAIVIELPAGGYSPQFRQRIARTSRVVQPRNGRPEKPISIAILPFSSVSADDDAECWSDGLTDELMSALARSAALAVVSRTSSFAFKGSRTNVCEIAKLLGADFVVEGTVRKSDRRVRVMIHLIPAATGLHLWSVTMEREIDDVWTVQQEIAKAITDALEIKLTPQQDQRVTKRLTTNPQAFELYLKARYLMERPDFASKQEAMKLFESAIAADSGYALPWLGLARCHLYWAMVGLEAPREPLARAKAALERALLADPELGECFGLLALSSARHDKNWHEAGVRFHTALDLAPHSAEIHASHAAEFLAPQARFEEAAAENRLARQLDPFSVQVALGNPYILTLSRRFEEAEEEYRRILASHPHHMGIRGGIAYALWGQGRLEEAKAEFEALAAHDPGSGQGKVFRAAMQAQCGDHGPALELLDELRNQATLRFVPAMSFVRLHIALRQLDQAVSALEQAYENQEDALLYAKVAFIFDPLRDHPGFHALLKKLHLN